MENYEVKNVSEASQIRKVYEDVVTNNIKYYRAVSKTNQIYGWDEKASKFIKAEIGQEWFDNPHYVEPQELIEEIVEEPIEEFNETIDELVEEIVEEVENVEPTEVFEEQPDYKALYEEKCGEFDALKGEYEYVKKSVDYYKQENEELKDGLSAFKTLLNKF